MQVRAVKSFIWHGPRDVDVGDILDVPDREAFLLVHGYEYCVPVDGEVPVAPVMMTVADPKPVRRR